MSLFTRTRFLQLLPLIFFGLVVVVWEAAVQILDISKFLLPAPSAVLNAFLDEPGRFVFHTWRTAYEALLGFGLGLALGVSLAAAIAYVRTLDRILMPYLVIIQVTPIIAIAPVLVLWFGFGLLPKVLIAFLISFFPITVNTAIGLRSADKDALDLMKVLAAKERFVFLRVRLPFALPYLLSSIKIAAPAAVIGAIIAEFVSSTQGLGYVILISKSTLRTADLFVAIVGSASLGITMFGLSVLTESKLLRWHESQIR